MNTKVKTHNLNTPTFSKTAMMFKLAQSPPDIWMTLPIKDRKWLINRAQHANINHTVPTNTDPHYNKALPSK
jgi:hypothetical protein